MRDDEAARSAKLRAFYARFVTGRGGAADPRIEQAFAAVPREPFAGPPPWFVLSFVPWNIHRPSRRYLETPDGDPAFLYQDTLIALDPARGINIGEPSLHARCLDALALQAGDMVLHIGAGSGYLHGGPGRVGRATGPRHRLRDRPWTGGAGEAQPRALAMGAGRGAIRRRR